MQTGPRANNGDSLLLTFRTGETVEMIDEFTATHDKIKCWNYRQEDRTQCNASNPFGVDWSYSAAGN